jgi:hypothetical protein
MRHRPEYAAALSVCRDDLTEISRLSETAEPAAFGTRSLIWQQPDPVRATLEICWQRLPEGAFVSVDDGKNIIGYTSTIRLPEHRVLTPHDWHSITDNGTGRTHDPAGDWLYAAWLMITAGPGHCPLMHPLLPLVRAMVKLAREKDMKGVALPVPFPGYRPRSGTTEYQREILFGPENLQSNSLHLIGVACYEGLNHELALPAYLQGSRHAALMTWRNPDAST